jgi:hypothetical protein
MLQISHQNTFAQILQNTLLQLAPFLTVDRFLFLVWEMLPHTTLYNSNKTMHVNHLTEGVLSALSAVASSTFVA